MAPEVSRHRGPTVAPPPAAGPLDAVRAFAVTIGGSVALDGVAAASLVSVARAAAAGQKPRWLALAGVAALALYLAEVRPRMRRWGATDDETEKDMRGDDLAPDDSIASTHAVTIEAPAADVWPWLAQIGQDRGGFYSYEWLENLAGCRMKNADRIHPEWQHRQVGETVKLHWAHGLPVARFAPGRILALEGWGSFGLEAIDQHRTRLIARGQRKRGLAGLWYILLIELPHFLMERKMLLGIKQRAERAHQSATRADIYEDARALGA